MIIAGLNHQYSPISFGGCFCNQLLAEPFYPTCEDLSLKFRFSRSAPTGSKLMSSLPCPYPSCPSADPSKTFSIIRHGFHQTRCGKRRRFLCKGCGKTFGRNSATIYHRLQHRRTAIDGVVAFSVEGVNKSAIARTKQITWNTVDRWPSLRQYSLVHLEGVRPELVLMP